MPAYNAKQQKWSKWTRDFVIWVRVPETLRPVVDDPPHLGDVGHLLRVVVTEVRHLEDAVPPRQDTVDEDHPRREDDHRVREEGTDRTIDTIDVVVIPIQTSFQNPAQ